ncbi:MAG: PD-(D/E)XK nuclease family protein [Christensenellales bacterium]|jgi:hypothetical protein
MEEVVLKADDEMLKNIMLSLKENYVEEGNDLPLTLPKVFSKEGQENFVTCWLAYLLDPKINGFGIEPLNALLRCINVEQAIDEEEVVVEKEYTFSEYGKRIDILITTSDFIIGIENKLYSGESGEQTKVYWKGMENLLKKDQHNNKSCLGIYLKPESNTSSKKSNDFKTVTYTDFYNELRSIEHDHCRDHRKNFFFYEFLLYVEEKLMSKSETGFQEPSKDVKLYKENEELLRKIAQKHSKYNEKLGVWLVEYIKKVSSSFPNNRILDAKPPKSHYWQIVEENCDWDEDTFHFELRWNNTKSISALTEDDSVQLCVHLEKRRSQLKTVFKEHRKSIPYAKDIKVNFSNEEESKKSVAEIVKLLNSDEFKSYSKIANDYYHEKRSR